MRHVFLNIHQLNKSEEKMSEQKAPKVKLNGRQWLAVIVCGMAYNALGILQYLARDFYVIYKESNGLTDSQMGTIMTAVGIAAVIAYFYNGFVTDLVRPKIMMMFSCSVCVVLALLLRLRPAAHVESHGEAACQRQH